MLWICHILPYKDGVKSLKSFYIIANNAKDEGLKFTKEIAEYIDKKGGICVIAEGNKKVEEQGCTFAADKVPPDTECVLVVGGDGTLIQAARELAGYNLPFLGINFGNLGFLTEVERNNVFQAIDVLFEGKFYIEERMMLEGKILRGGKVVEENIALNDIVFARAGTLRVVDFKIYLNGEYFNNYSADGMIVATPTGSTAYNLSAGGPIVSPAAKLMIVTPICPHTFNSRSIILPECDTIEVEVCADRNGFDDERQLSFDGGSVLNLQAGDRISIKAATESTKIIRIKKISFIEQLRNKMGNK